MLNVGKIEEGLVLDHIKAGKSMEIYRYLQLDKLDCTVAIIKNARSNKMKKKDIIKVECDINMLNLDILVLQPTSESVIVNAREEPLNLEKLQALPGIVGYIVQHGDSLWDIAKRFHTTMGRVMETNELADDQIHPGDRLLLVKEVAKA